MFLSQKPILYALNIGESSTLGDDLEAAVSRSSWTKWHSGPTRASPPFAEKWKPSWPKWTTPRRPNSCPATGSGKAGWCGSSAKAMSCWGSSVSLPPARTSAAPGPFPAGAKAPQAAGVIHTDLEHHFIRAETIRWDQLLDAGCEAAARSRGTLRLEGKEYVVQDGELSCISAQRLRTEIGKQSGAGGAGNRLLLLKQFPVLQPSFHCPRISNHVS